MKVNIQSRGRVSSSGGGASGWRAEQKANFAGRGQKWVKLTGELLDQLRSTLAEFREMGEDTSAYESWIAKAGYAFVRYSGPRVLEGPALAFEVRINGSKIDHPKHLFQVTEDVWMQLAEDHDYLGGTPFSLNLEVAAG